MENKEIRTIIIKEMGVEEIPEEAQDDIIKKLGDVVLKSLTASIFQKIPDSAREEFERVAAYNDDERTQVFLEEHVPDLHILVEEEVKKAMRKFAEMEAMGGKVAKERGEE